MAAPPDRMRYALGVDGGNSKTLALVAAEDGTILGHGRSGCSDIYSEAGALGAVEAILAAANAALESAGLRRAQISRSCFSLAGADWPEDFAFLRATLSQAGYSQGLAVVNDGLGALFAALPAKPGVVVACGTGATTGARGPAGQLWHSSFWQQPQGGQELARLALRAVYRADLGIDPPTGLTEHVLAFFGEASVEAVLHRMTQRERAPIPPLQYLAPLVLDAAQEGDAAARRLVQGHGAALGDLALAAARRVNLAGPAFPLGLAGGLFRHAHGLLAESLVTRVRASAPGVQAFASRFEPVVGALFQGLLAIGVPVTTPLTDRLAATLPPADFFAT